MKDDHYREVLQGLQQWLERHKNPDVPALQFGTVVDGSFSPRQLVHEVRARSDSGKMILSVIDYAIEGHSLDAVLKSFSISGAAEHKVARGYRATAN